MAKWAAYIVTVGTVPGVYDSWDDTAEKVIGVAGSVYKGYKTRIEAEAAYRRAHAEGRVRRAFKDPTPAELVPPTPVFSPPRPPSAPVLSPPRPPRPPPIVHEARRYASPAPSRSRAERPAEHATARQFPAASPARPLPRARSPAAESDASSASCKTDVSYVVPEEDPTRRMRWSDYLAARAEGAFADAESARGSAYASLTAVPGSQGESPRRNGRARGSAASGTPVGTVRTTASELEYWDGTPPRRAHPSPEYGLGATTSQPHPSSPAPGSISSLRTGVTYFEPDLSRLSINDAGAPSPSPSTRTHTGADADAGASTGSRSSGSSRRSKRTFAEAGVQTPRFMRAGAPSASNALTRAASEPAAAAASGSADGRRIARSQSETIQLSAPLSPLALSLTQPTHSPETAYSGVVDPRSPMTRTASVSERTPISNRLSPNPPSISALFKH